MRWLTRWFIKLSVAGVLYVAVANGAALKLPKTVMGFEVPPEAQQALDQMTGLDEQTTDGFKNIADAMNASLK